MDKKEAIKTAELAGQVLTTHAIINRDALSELLACARREVEREEAEKPKRPSLDQQIDAINFAIIKGCFFGGGNGLEEAGNTLRTLREEGALLLKRVQAKEAIAWGHAYPTKFECETRALLTKLGLSP